MFETRLRQENKDKESRKKLMDLHLKQFKKEHLQKLSEASSTLNLEQVKDDMLTASSPKKVSVHVEEFEGVESLSAEEEQQRQIMDLAEKHAHETAMNKIFDQNTRRQRAAVDQGKFNAAVELSMDDNPSSQVDEDPEIKAMIHRLESLKASRLTANTSEGMDKLKFSKAAKPAILTDHTSSADYLDKWLSGDAEISRSNFEDLLRARKEAPVESASAGEVQSKPSDDRQNSSSSSVRGSEVDFSADSPLMLLLNELRREVKTLKQHVETSKTQNSVPSAMSQPFQSQQYHPQQFPYSYANPYSMPPIYPPPLGMPHPYQPSPYVTPAMHGEANKMNKIAEDLERENQKFNAKSADDVLLSTAKLDQHTRAFSRHELKHQEEMRGIQNEIELLKTKRALEDLKMEIDSEKISRAKELEHAQFILDHKQKLQELKLKQALLKEQRLLDLHAGHNMFGSENGDSVPGVRIAAGVGPSAIPLDICNGAEIFIDGK